MGSERQPAETDAGQMNPSEKVLAAYELGSPSELLLRRPRGYHLAGLQGRGPPRHGMPVTFVGQLTQYTNYQRDKHFIIHNVLDEPGLGGVTLNWLSSLSKGAAMERALSERCPAGTMVVATGKAHYQGDRRLTLRYVEMEPASGAVVTAIQNGYVLPIPIYPLTGRLSQARVRAAVRSYLRSGHGRLTDGFPVELERSLDLPSLSLSLEVVHGLRTVSAKQGELLLANLSKYQKRIDVERLWAVMCRMPQLSQAPPPALALRDHCTGVLDHLSFKLTAGQSAALEDVLTDLAKPHVTRRLLQGDVGCGKSIVAVLALLASARSGAPAALLAPTEVLADQLHRATQALATTVGIKTHFVAGKLTAAKRRTLKVRAESAEPAIFVGTHSLAALPFARLGLLVIDEEHRFGVAIKERLIALNPHVITMSATPIPRSLATVMYAGHGVSSITERPAGRQVVKTKIVTEQGSGRLFGFMRDNLARGQQIFVVCPSIESEDIANVGEMARVVAAQVGEDKVRALHGEMRSAEVQQVLADFREHKFGVLVATTIVEVGIDVPSATLMVICDPERLGLSQLHQIRGRVGRGKDPGFCALLTRAAGVQRERLDFFARTHDGFALAERDLQMRGAGNLAGMEQSGFLGVDLLALAPEASAIQRFLTKTHASTLAPPTAGIEGACEDIQFEVAL